MTDATAIITRCTRNGVTAWQSVALQLGRSVDSVRSEHDPNYLKVRPWPHPCEVVEPEPVIDLDDMSSPYPKGEGMKARILALLERQSMSAELLSSFLHSPVNSVRARLDRLFDGGKVYHDGRYPRTWGLMEADGTRRVYARPIAEISRQPILAGASGVPDFFRGTRRPR